ncbi:hypothetical protein MKL26_07800 [Streptococcus suis]|nr:hypothetical protein [Streptococcus suis]
MADRIIKEVDIHRKIREMDDAEQDFLRQKKFYQKHEENLSERRRILDDLIHSEHQKMKSLLDRINLSFDVASDFFRELNDLKEQSKGEFNLQQLKLEEEREKAKMTFRKEQAQREKELLEMRKNYASTNK